MLAVAPAFTPERAVDLQRHRIDRMESQK